MPGISQRLYDAAPIFLQQLAVSMHGWRLRRREYGDAFLSLLERFEELCTRSPAQIQDYQTERLRGIFQHALQTVPWYRRLFKQHGLDAQAIRTFQDLHKLPLTDSSALERHGEGMVSQSADRLDRLVGHTSGTTGRSKTIYYDRNVCHAKNAVEWRMKRSAGIEIGDPLAYIMGHRVVPLSQRKPPFWRMNRPLNHLMFSAFHFSPSHWDAYIDALSHFGALGMDGYPSTVSMFAEAMRINGRSHSLKAAFVSSEVLVPWQRTAIEGGFRCEVYNYYGMAERAVFASECSKHSGLHVNTDFGHLELLNDKLEPVPRGVSGRVVITGWHNFTMPFIRYRTNDWATWATEPCSCGSPFPLLQAVDGREEDQIATPDGRFLDVSFTYSSFEKVQERIVESQIYQYANGEVEIRIVPYPSFSESDAQQLVSGFRKFMGKTAPVKVSIREQIPRSPGGKLRWLISEVPRRLG